MTFPDLKAAVIRAAEKYAEHPVFAYGETNLALRNAYLAGASSLLPLIEVLCAGLEDCQEDDHFYDVKEVFRKAERMIEEMK